MRHRAFTPAECWSRATLAHETNAVARCIGMVTSRAKVVCCLLQIVNGLAAAELMCADLRTQAAASLQLASSLIMEWMERFQGNGGAGSAVNWPRAGCSSREFSIPAVRGMVTARRSR
jgi:hypothetical protein